MSKLRIVGALAALLACPAGLASAQDAEAPGPERAAEAQPAAQPAEAQPAEAQPAEEQPAEAQPAEVQAEPPPAASPPRYAPRSAPPPPIMIVVLARGVPDELAAAAQQALVDQVSAMAGGRPVHALGAAEIRDAIAACRDDACIGAQLGQAGAQAGVIARLRGRRPVQATLEIRDPMSGAPRREPVSGALAATAAELPAAMAALSAQLEGAMPNPPPPPATLLVTVNVDGARVQLDGEDVGTSPVAPVEVADGAHEVVVIAPGHLSVRRPVRVQSGEQARLDVTLQAIAGGAGGGGGEAGFAGGSEGGGGQDDLLGQWWFWTAVGGGAAVLIGVAIAIGVVVANGSSTPMQLDPTGIPLPPISGGM